MATQRGYYKEELVRSVSNIEMALTHLTRVISAYAEPHPEIAEPIAQIGDLLVMAAETIAKINETI